MEQKQVSVQKIFCVTKILYVSLKPNKYVFLQTICQFEDESEGEDVCHLDVTDKGSQILEA